MSVQEGIGFWLPGSGPGAISAFFEDDGRTGYLYIYDGNQDKIVNALHIYNRSPTVNVQQDDVFITWSTDLNKCGVVVWDDMRGVIDIRTGESASIPLKDRSTRGVTDTRWLEGFEQEEE